MYISGMLDAVYVSFQWNVNPSICVHFSGNRRRERVQKVGNPSRERKGVGVIFWGKR